MQQHSIISARYSDLVSTLYVCSVCYQRSTNMAASAIAMHCGQIREKADRSAVIFMLELDFELISIVDVVVVLLLLNFELWPIYDTQ